MRTIVMAGIISILLSGCATRWDSAASEIQKIDGYNITVKYIPIDTRTYDLSIAYSGVLLMPDILEWNTRYLKAASYFMKDHCQSKKHSTLNTMWPDGGFMILGRFQCIQ